MQEGLVKDTSVWVLVYFVGFSPLNLDNFPEEESFFLHLTRRNKNSLTSDGLRREYKAMVSFGIDETTMGSPSPLFLITCEYSKKKQKHEGVY